MLFDVSSLSIEQQNKIGDGVTKYINIQDLFNKNSKLTKDVDFQKAFTGFYKVRRNEEWRDEFYRLFEDEKKVSELTFEQVYNDLIKKVKKEEKSFASKMYHTFNKNAPIIDGNVLKGLKIPNRSKKGMAIDIYKALYDEYYKAGGLMDEANRDDLSTQFDTLCVSKGIKSTDLSKISLVKKIDFYLWALFAK